MRFTRMVLLMVVACFAITPAAHAATFLVTTSADDPSGACSGTSCQSIRAAVAAAALSAGPDTIRVPSGDYQLVQGQILLTSDVTIEGDGARTTIVRGNANAFRAFEIPTGVTASITGVSLVGGRATDENSPTFYAGGLVRNSGSVTLTEVRVTGGVASSGGGVANIGGTMTIDRSLIHGNTASIDGSDSGGIVNQGGGNLVVRNSTIAFNHANAGGGAYASWGRSQARPNTALFEFVTIARNTAGNGNGGIAFDAAAGDTLRVHGSIIAGNGPTNCATTPASDGGNVADDPACGFTTSTSPIVSDELTDRGGDTDVVDLTSGSPARDLVPAVQCLPTDQRGFPRPVGAFCDAGAIEVGAPAPVIQSPSPDRATNADAVTLSGTASPNVGIEIYAGDALVGETNSGDQGRWEWDVDLTTFQDGAVTLGASAPGTERATVRVFVDRTKPATTIFDHPPATTDRGDVTFTFTANEPGATYACGLSGTGISDPEPKPCVPTGVTYSGLGNGEYTFSVRATDPAGNVEETSKSFSFVVAQAPAQTEPVATASPVATPAPTPAATPTPTPTVGVDVVIRPTGRVLVKVPGTNQFIPVTRLEDIPFGSEIDATSGRVRISFETVKGKVQTGTFYGGVFRITQVGKILDLKLTEPLAACPKQGKAATAQSKKKAKKRRLWGDGKGSFRTSGKYSAATVRGTKWLVEDSCAGTLTRVATGVVQVKHGKKKILLRAGKRYLAKAPR